MWGYRQSNRGWRLAHQGLGDSERDVIIQAACFQHTHWYTDGQAPITWPDTYAPLIFIELCSQGVGSGTISIEAEPSLTLGRYYGQTVILWNNHASYSVQLYQHNGTTRFTRIKQIAGTNHTLTPYDMITLRWSDTGNTDNWMQMYAVTNF